MGKEEVLMILAKSSECLRESEVLFGAQLYSGSINRAYYSIFNAVQAVLQFKDIMTKTHQGAHAQFQLHFIKTGVFSEDIKKIPQQVEQLRIKGDYEPDQHLYKEDAQLALQLAHQFYEVIKKHLDADN
ncbi:MAG: hypothetical protein JWO06_3300 [Bacteroidota bacterium]|nr:hypothetical protein [Bacteroidota bacterium]